uniref:Uncharacterized protein n=1 Tax=Aquila chrysaetos chrysaetos TaxID=223781 RepID=A0A663E433_AQUCH
MTKYYSPPCFLRFITKTVNFRHNCKQANRLKTTSLRKKKKKSQKDIPGWNAAELIPTSPGVLLVFMIELLIL